jgi:hypothetical protein
MHMSYTSLYIVAAYISLLQPFFYSKSQERVASKCGKKNNGGVHKMVVGGRGEKLGG